MEAVDDLPHSETIPVERPVYVQPEPEPVVYLKPEAPLPAEPMKKDVVYDWLKNIQQTEPQLLSWSGSKLAALIVERGVVASVSGQFINQIKAQLK